MSNIRIIAGRLRGRSIKLTEGKNIRPTLSHVREAAFNLLTHHRAIIEYHPNGLQQATIADICCGSGALGFEALSRGASHATFVDNAPPSLALVATNAQHLGVTQQVQTIRASAEQLPPLKGNPCDFVLMDPPYQQQIAPKAINSLIANGWLAPNAIILLETHARETLLPNPIDGITLLDSRTYGTCALHLLHFSM